MDPPAYTPDLPAPAPTTAPTNSTRFFRSADARNQILANAFMLIGQAAALNKIKCLSPEESLLLMGKTNLTDEQATTTKQADSPPKKNTGAAIPSDDPSAAGSNSTRAANERPLNNNSSGATEMHYAFIVYRSIGWTKSRYIVYMSGDARDTVEGALDSLLGKTEAAIAEIYRYNWST